MTVDAHTHNLHATDALIAVEPDTFFPQPGQLYSVGIHPWHTDTITDDDLTQLRQTAQHQQVVAIGETGLDSLRGAPLGRQTEIFERHLLLAQELGKPVIIHSVRTSQQVVQCCRRLGITMRCAIHGMRGNERVAQTLIDAGFYLSFGPRFNPAAVLATPHDRLLIETDDTGMTIAQVADAIAPTLQLTASSLLAVATQNLQNFIQYTMSLIPPLRG